MLWCSNETCNQSSDFPYALFFSFKVDQCQATSHWNVGQEFVAVVVLARLVNFQAERFTIENPPSINSTTGGREVAQACPHETTQWKAAKEKERASGMPHDQPLCFWMTRCHAGVLKWTAGVKYNMNAVSIKRWCHCHDFGSHHARRQKSNSNQVCFIDLPAVS